jgi:hypothetical protein
MDKRKEKGYNPKKIGEKSEIRFISQCVLNEWIVLTPWGDSERYDIVIDRGDGLETVQIKTGRLDKGSIRFSLCSLHYHTKKGQFENHYRKSYDNQVDFFGVYCHELDKCYLIPMKELEGLKSEGCLRVEPTKNNQTKTIRLAEEFEI